jgi:hypothetical protein
MPTGVPGPAFEAAKTRGAKLGGLRAYGIQEREEADARAEALRPILESLAGLPANAIAIELNKRNVPTPNGGRWHHDHSDPHLSVGWQQRADPSRQDFTPMRFSSTR